MIDWEKQWELHAPNFLNGYAHVSLQEFGSVDQAFRMMSGPGFGDLSHPTTRIMLTLMPHTIDQPVIDVGCGSGVLSLAAKLSGAPEVYGIDIDDAAIAHAKRNAELNQLNCTFSTVLPLVPSNPLILMNMISSEQRHAWEALPNFRGVELIVSGFPIEEAPPHYGKILRELSLEGWKGYHIKKEG
ncbi:MAG: 50S ribosomal protein L11 methyltransferase [Chlamydiia bacterium]|nr:50S ribosomal protein L11 methyltransferase [Chlamydiia bacterium]